MGDITLRKALDDYKTVYMAYRNFAQRTREEYLNDLEDWVKFLERSGIHLVRELVLPVIERYVANLEQQGFASLTRKRKVVAIRSFLSFLYEDKYLNVDLAKKIVLPFIESSYPKVLTPTECDQLRLACASNSRDRAIIELLLQTGIKLSELIHLTINDIPIDDTEKIGEENNGYVRILGGRGKKERLIPLNDKACGALNNYVKVRRNTGNSSLFSNRFGEPLGERGVQKMLRKYLQTVGIQRAGVHTLRHTFGLHHISKGMSIKTLQDAMGHKDTRSTMIYVSLVEEMRNGLQRNAL